MAVDLLGSRTDLPYLRRRVRPGAEPKVVATTSRPSLRLRDPGSAQRAAYASPALTSDATLSEGNPVVRLNRRQSAIGSLTVAGVQRICWEADGKAGDQLVSAGDDDPRVPLHGGRPLVQGYKGEVVLGLRHIAHLRRVLLEGGELTVKLTSGASIKVAPQQDGAPTRLSILRIGGELELRREHADVGGDFGFDLAAGPVGSARQPTDPPGQPVTDVHAQIIQAPRDEFARRPSTVQDYFKRR